ncbi:hypothetical protein GCM10009827_117100 [Dactylosporangium maewongense]|uniref:Uncharacterized protein n=1 Tax=Dactylosporangium maewongense TaxID=634393 RepID=A0ABN2DH36_9ACTN
MTEPADPNAASASLGGQLAALLRRVNSGNTPGDLDGLFAQHVLGNRGGLTWNLGPSRAWLDEHTYQLDEVGPLATIGYAISPSDPDTTAMAPAVVSGLQRLMQRDHFRAGRLNFMHDMRVLLGVGLAAKAVQGGMPEGVAWLAAMLQDTRLKPTDSLHDLAQQYVLAITAAITPRPISSSSLASDGDKAMAYWMVTTGLAELSDRDDMRSLQLGVLHAAAMVDAAALTIPEAALLAFSAIHATVTSIDQLVLSKTHLSLVLNRFESAMLRWRWDDPVDRVREPVQWPIPREEEVQAILWLILRSVFDDLIDEDTLPRFGHGSTRADFAIPSLKVLIEAKYVHNRSEFKKVEHEVMVDSIAYLKRTDLYRELVVFIYDSTSSVEHHELTRRTLLQVDHISDVIIVCPPGVLTPAAVQTRPSTGRRRRQTRQTDTDTQNAVIDSGL